MTTLRMTCGLAATCQLTLFRNSATYYITVTALGEATSGLGANASGAFLGFNIAGHTIARATLVCSTSAS